MPAKTFDEVYLVNYSSYHDLNLYEAGRQKCMPSYCYGPIIRKLNILHYIKSGEGVLQINNQSFPVKEKELFIIPAQTPAYYQASEEKPWEYIWIQFHGFKVKEMMKRCGLSEQHPVLPLTEYAGKVEQCLTGILENHDDEYACVGLVYQLFQYMVHAAGREDPISKREKNSLTYIQQTIHFIQQKYSDPIRVQDIAEYCGLNRSYLTRLFKHATGYTPQEYLIQYRVNQARKLLEESQMPIQYIAYCIGYHDSFTFSKLFKRETGFSPSEYRKYANEKQPIVDHTLHMVIGDPVPPFSH